METCKIQYLRGLAIIKNKVHYLQTISVLGLCTVGRGGVGVCVNVLMGVFVGRGQGGSGPVGHYEKGGGQPGEWFI